MTPEEIKKMALRFALEKSEGDAYDPFEKEYAAEVLQWLSEQFCIVEKSKVKAEYNFFKNSWNDTELTETTMASFESLFGKEMFEEEGK